MKGDFSRDSDAPHKQFSGVLMQQGRVQTDADWNEQWAIGVRATRLALSDLIGPHGGPVGTLGFQLAPKSKRLLTVKGGTYYVDGIRVTAPILTDTGDWKTFDLDDIGCPPGMYLAYLEVWERHVNVIEDPDIREVALMGPDTCTRAQVVWATKLLQLGEEAVETLKGVRGGSLGMGLQDLAQALLSDYVENPRAPTLRARTVEAEEPKPCSRAAQDGYRGFENQLYRVEIYHPPPAGGENAPPTEEGDVKFYFKWSRENGSVVFPIAETTLPERNDSEHSTTVTVKLGHLGRDARYGLVPGDIVEFVSDLVTWPKTGVTLDGEFDIGRAGPLGCVRQVRPEELEVVIEVYSGESFTGADASQHPYLRRWDQRETRKGRGKSGVRPLVRGAVPVDASDIGSTWFELEDGVEVQFGSQTGAGTAAAVRGKAGDYWQIESRVVAGDVLWPQTHELVDGSMQEVPAPLPPKGISRHFAPLAIAQVTKTKVQIQDGEDLRYAFSQLAVPFKPGS